MSATLTWASSGAATKTGTAIGNYFTDLKALIDSKSGDATFNWEVCASSVGSTPYYLFLRRKDLSDGRILIISWSSSPAGNNSAILDTAPTTNQVYIAWFPNGTATTPSNLTASSGTIAGDDTNCVKVAAGPTIGIGYTTNTQVFYFDSAEAMWFFHQNPSSASNYVMGAGKIAVDGADVAYDGTAGLAISSWHNVGVPGSVVPSWQSSNITAGTNAAYFRINYGTNNKLYFFGWSPLGSWANQAVGSADILTDTANSKAWFVPLALLGQTKGEGFVLKLRQIAYGPGTTGPLTVYNTTGPVVAARQSTINTGGSNGTPWFTNFKL